MDTTTILIFFVRFYVAYTDYPWLATSFRHLIARLCRSVKRA
ncbi:hypothetical protein AAUPMC_20211, partial [Pasteurella multocida subsp. multocida str. Anand1_cattle]